MYIYLYKNRYSIPFINYLKLKAICRGKYIKKIKILLIIVFPIFCVCRYIIGVFRYMEEDLNPTKVRNMKGVSASIISSLDIIISTLIIYELKKNLGVERLQNKYLNKTSIYSYIRKSNYAVLILIDVCGFCLSFLSYSYINEAYFDLVMPFETLKNNFILILAVDAIIFKVDAFKMMSSGKTMGSSNYYNNNSSYVNGTNMNNASSSNIKNYNNTTYGVLANYNNNNNNNSQYNINKGNGIMSSSHTLFSSSNNNYSNSYNNVNNNNFNDFGSFHASNALNKMKESNYMETCSSYSVGGSNSKISMNYNKDTIKSNYKYLNDDYYDKINY